MLIPSIKSDLCSKPFLTAIQQP